MNSIFSNKELLKQEYQRLFLNNLSDLSLFKQSIESRYDKNITEAEIQNFFLVDDQSLNQFVQTKNEGRFTHFFGNYQNPNKQDAQIRTLDRFILDSIHFEIMRTFFLRLNEEYPFNQIEIDNVWLDTTNDDQNLEGVQPIHIIQRNLVQSKALFYQDLIFSSDEAIELFTFDNKKIHPNLKVFAKWLPEPASFYRSFFKTLNNPIFIGFAGAVLGALCGLFFGSIGIIVGAALGLTIAVACYMTIDYIFSSESELLTIDKESTLDVSYTSMMKSMPTQTITQTSNPILSDEIEQDDSTTNLTAFLNLLTWPLCLPINRTPESKDPSITLR